MTTKVTITTEQVAHGVTVQVTAKYPGPDGAVIFTAGVPAGQSQEFYVHSQMELLVQELPVGAADHG